VRGVLLLLTLRLALPAEVPHYELRGRLVPPSPASVWVHDAASPFEKTILADPQGRFRFQHLPPGTYTLGVFVPGRGEKRQTIEVGPSHADRKHRIQLVLQLRDSDLETQDALRRDALVSTRELAIPQRAWHEYDEACKKLASKDAAGAAARLERAVALAPGFTEAWNRLGTIAYQTREYPRAEHCFRQALQAEPAAFEPLVNLGGVLINLGQYQEALKYNRHAVLRRPHDALANSQLGMTYFYLDQLDLAERYLQTAVHLDPAHFSHPQLMLAEIHLRRKQPAAAARELEEFLHYHPDWPQAARVRQTIARLRAASR
jgi:tetratricopeptide (TPR) repeat protein